MSDHNQFHQLVSKAQTVFVIYNTPLSQDYLASSVALSQVLNGNTQKRLLSPQKPEMSQAGSIRGWEQTETEIGHQNLLIGFDYHETAVDNVSYHISDDNKKFYLTIKPQKGHDPLDSKSVEFDYVGADVDMIITLGVNRLQELDKLYLGYEETYEKTTVVSFGGNQTNYADIHFDLNTYSSCSELVARLLAQGGYSFDPQSASNLIAGIESATDNLRSPRVTAETFETLAGLLREGGQRSVRQTSPTSTHHQKTTQSPEKIGSFSKAVSSGQPFPAQQSQTQPQEVKEESEKEDKKHMPSEGSVPRR